VTGRGILHASVAELYMMQLTKQQIVVRCVLIWQPLIVEIQTEIQTC